MPVARRPAKSCDLADLFRLLGSPHILDILHVTLLHEEPRRFKDLEATLGISPNTLSERLKGLVASGLLVRRSFDEVPPRVEYSPSAKAKELQPVFDALAAWSKRNNLNAMAPAPILAR
jgi:DNA-binding HxlR family transcriptional regulator